MDLDAPLTGWFVTGTDTEVGKSVVTAALAAGLRADGRDVRALKPLATGGPPPGDDATLLGRAAGHEPAVFETFPTPAAPGRAARLAGRKIDPAAVVGWIRAQAGSTTLVEGVGGWRVPLWGAWCVDDLAAELSLPVIVVAANRLGVLNHTLLTVEAVAARGLSVAAVVLNDGAGTAGALADWNAEDLRARLAHDVPLVRLPQLTIPAGLAAAGRRLRDAMAHGPR